MFSVLFILLWFGSPLAIVAGAEALERLLVTRQRRRVARIERRIAAGLCVRCGYDVRASGGRCSECGRRIPSDEGWGSV
jgi:hypothetical protein